MRRMSHVSPQLNKHRLHCHIAVPALEAGQLGWVDEAVAGVNTWEVDFGDELDGGWLVGVLVATVHFEGVDAVFVDRVRRAQNGAVPVGHQEVIALCETIGTRLSPETLLTLLQLLQKSEVARNLGSHLAERYRVRLRNWLLLEAQNKSEVAASTVSRSRSV